MSDFRSAIYAGWVSHARFAPRRHRLRYPMFQMLIDLDEAPGIARALRLFSRNRFNVFSHYDADHGEGRPGALREWVESTLNEAGMSIHGGQILLLAMPRLFGHVFNPLSVFYCHHREGALAAVIYEVNNTIGERHAYVIGVPATAADTIRQSCAKAFYVSPFLPMDMSYDFELSRPRETLRTNIVARDGSGDPILTASFSGARRELTDVGLVRLLVEFPFLTLNVVAAIHLEAVKLWLKGIRFAPAPTRPADGVTVVPTVVSQAATARMSGENVISLGR